MPEAIYVRGPEPESPDTACTTATTGRLAGWRWRLNRLRCMTPAEIGHRLWRAARSEAERAGLRSGLFLPLAAPPPNLDVASTCWIGDTEGIDHAAILAAADRLLAGKHDVFALSGIDLGSPPRWNRDPKTGIEAPLAFGKTLDYRDPQLVGDIKYLWEPNRHLHLVTLAQAWRVSGDARYTALIREHLQSWFVACPAGLGANWASALEHGLRLISWSLTWQLLGGTASPLFAGEEGEKFRQDWLDSIYAHAEFILGHFSLHSSANNHLIGEASGLFIAALTWPHWPRAKRWRDKARAMLEREALLQNAADGANREQAVAYQQFELDLLLLPLLAARAHGDGFSLDYSRRLESMLDYLASIMDVGGKLPMFGDADDGAVTRLDPHTDFNPGRSLLATGAVLFRRGDFKAKAMQLDDKSRWLLGPEADTRFAAIKPAATPLPVSRQFPEGGYFILGRDFEGEDEIRLIADAGPLGYGGIAAHGHADALSFTLSLAGREFLIDPGTYAYHTEERWRAYFRGTAAHNTLRVDGEDQSLQGGNFLWLDKARACGHMETNENGSQCFTGWHDGYLRLADPVRHLRSITLDPRTGAIVIDDHLKMNGEHEVELFFHFAEDCRVTPTARGCIAEQAGRSLELRLPQQAGARHEILCGSTHPIAGWVSRRFDRKAPAPTLRWQARLRGDTHLRCEIDC
jgi:hypothetical protein